MITRWKRSVAAVAIGAAAVLGLPATAASAVPVESGTLSMDSDPGDYIGQGQTWSYDTAEGDRFGATISEDGSYLRVSVDGAGGDWWFLDIAAPPGEPLVPGTYTGATRAAFRAPGEPGLDVFGQGRGCNQVAGSFVVTEAVYGPAGYVEAFQATFEQHCEGGEPALRGAIRLDNPAPPVELDLGISVRARGTASTVNGQATVRGTVTCTEPVTVQVTGTVVQVRGRLLATGSFQTAVDCDPAAPADWQATAVPGGIVAFGRGDAQVDATASATDPNYGTPVSVSTSRVVRLARG